MTAEVVCQRCGHLNPADANFCSSCGGDLSGIADQKTDAYVFDLETTAEDVAAAELGGIPILLVRQGPKAGSRYALDTDRITVGRHPESDIFLDDITVSRRHAELVADGDTFSVVDVGSLNGTYVNRTRIDRALLVDGDELQVGKFKLLYLRGDE